MSISYNLGIPAAGNNPSVDQPKMKDNNDNINNLIGIDHVAFNTSGSGKHLQVTFNSNNVPSIPTSPPVLFTNDDAFSIPQLFFYSGSAAHTSSQYVASTNGSTFLLGGMILKWGTSTANNPALPVVFASAFPNQCFGVFLQPTDPGYTGSMVPITITASGFSARRQSGSGNTGVFYLAIGN